MMSMGHFHDNIDQTTHWTSATTATGIGIGIMYAVIYNSGNNISTLNTHFDADHVSHP